MAEFGVERKGKRLDIRFTRFIRALMNLKQRDEEKWIQGKINNTQSSSYFWRLKNPVAALCTDGFIPKEVVKEI